MASVSNIVTLKTAFPKKTKSPQQKIEAAMGKEKFQVVEDQLFGLFKELAASPDNSFSRSYLLKAANALADVSLTHAFRLSSSCINELVKAPTDEKIQETVCQFAGNSMRMYEARTGGDYKPTSRVNLEIMKMSSEFLHSQKSGDIFEHAAISYRQYLVFSSPVQRYDELAEIAKWIEVRNYPSPMLESFVGCLMNSAEKCGTFLGIPLEEDIMFRSSDVIEPVPS